MVLFAGILLHIYQALILTLNNNKARPLKYVVNDARSNSKWYSRSMGLLRYADFDVSDYSPEKFWVVSRFTDEVTGGAYYPV